MNEQVNLEIAQLYVAMFGRAPDGPGLAYWAGLREAGYSAVQVSDLMFGTTPARSYFPDGLSNADTVAAFYINVLGRQADAEGLAYWTAKLDQSGTTFGSVVMEMISVIATYSGSDPAGISSAAFFNNRAAAAQFYAERNGSTTYAAQVLEAITSDASTVMAARTLVLPDGIVGWYDGGGFSEVSVGALGGDATVGNVQAGTGLTIRGTMSDLLDPFVGPRWNFTFQLVESYTFDDELVLTLSSADSIRTGNVRLPGVDHLQIVGVDLNDVAHYAGLYLTHAYLQTLTISGDVSISSPNSIYAENVDASGVTGGADVWLVVRNGLVDEAPVVYGSPGDDTLYGYGYLAGVVDVHGGDGDDILQTSGSMSLLVGGAGADEFGIDGFYSFDGVRVYATVADFNPAEGDTIRLPGIWYPSRVNLPSSASLDDYLNACATRTSGTTVRWFQHQEDTYVVVDRGGPTVFQDGVDGLIRLTGLIDLGSLSDNGWSLGI